MGITKTEFTIENAQNGFILESVNAGKNVFFDKESMCAFIAKSIACVLKNDKGKIFTIKIEIDSP